MSNKKKRSSCIKRYLTAVLISISIHDSAKAIADSGYTPILNIESAIEAAQANDPWLLASQHAEYSLQAQSIAAGQLPDPRISVGLANIAADSFNFPQERMTQLKIGISQKLPRGKSLKLKQQKIHELSQQYPLLRSDRKARLASQASLYWLDGYQAQEKISLIEKNRSLFQYLVDVAEANYTSAFGGTRQQDVIRAQLELIMLDDRLTVLAQEKDLATEKLLGLINHHNTQSKPQIMAYPEHTSYAKQLPTFNVLHPILLNFSRADDQRLIEHFSQHPSIIALDQKLIAAETQVELTKQNNKPEFVLNASYGYRNDDDFGQNRADLFSMGLSFDVPLHRKNKQDQQTKAALSEVDAIESQKWLGLRKMLADFKSKKNQLNKLNQRLNLYEKHLLPQIADQAEASLTAYTNDDGDFAEVMRSRIAELNAEIDFLTIKVKQQKTTVELNYFLLRNTEKITLPMNKNGEQQ